MFEKNLLQILTFLCGSGSAITILIHYVSYVSPFSGIIFPIFVVFLFIISIAITFNKIHGVLHFQKPARLNIDPRFKYSPILLVLPASYLKRKLHTYSSDSIETEYDTNELSVISTVLEKKLVSSWYLPYISEDIGFPFACKQLLDQMIGKAFQVSNKIKTKDVYVDICSILVGHFKEYKKALKKYSKMTGAIEIHYKKTHKIFDASSKTQCQSGEYCTNVLRVILKELLPWEMWDTPHSELLVRLLSKRLDDFIKSTLSSPVWLNDKLVSMLLKRGENKEVNDEKDNSEEQIETTILHAEKLQNNECEVIENQITKTSAPALEIRPPVLTFLNTDVQKEVECSVGENGNSLSSINICNAIDIESSPVLRRKRGRQGRNEVKIHDRIIEGSVKTWETDIDLQCISLGQDLLASLDGEITLSHLWEQDPNEAADGWSPNPLATRKSPQPLWFGEEDIDLETEEPHIELESQKKLPSPTKKQFSPKPADALLKDIQSTVSQAKNKIGDLQVATDFDSQLDVARKQLHSGDEAAGMMEGLLDFGIAGFKKGLRLTRLHDDSQERSPSHAAEQHLENLRHPDDLMRRGLNLDDLPAALNEEPSTEPRHVVIQDDDVPEIVFKGNPHDTPEYAMNDSPEPLYEDTEDLSSSIAKLRSLLHHTDSNPSSINTWTPAEETRGRTQRHPCNRPVDQAALADEYDMNADRNSLPEQTTNNMQRLDKLFQRTVTGVFNSIKTAVGAEGDEQSDTQLQHVTNQNWSYVYTEMDHSVAYAVARFVDSRRHGAAVDAGLDSLRNLEQAPPPEVQQEPEDFDEWCSGEGARTAGTAEVLCSLGLWESHVTHRLAVLLLGDASEFLLNQWLKSFTEWLRSEIFNVFQNMSADSGDEDKEMIEFDLKETCDLLMLEMPSTAYIFGEETLSAAVKLAVSSFSHQDINENIIYHLLDLASIHFLRAASERNLSLGLN